MPSPSEQSRLRIAFVAVGAAALAIVFAASRSNARSADSFTASSQRQPVLVELFTSEGCSDCPPADALLAKLDKEQFVPGAEAIVLSEHVTYWNYLGWRDPFSFDAMDQRQRNYADNFGLSSVYTPQMVVDGSAEFVGSDSGKLTRTVQRAASAPKPALEIVNAHRAADGSVAFAVRGAIGGNVTLKAALAEDATRSEVGRGENAGRTLHHVAVVRVLQDFNFAGGDARELQLPAPGDFNNEKDGAPLRLVVFLVNRSNGHVLAAAQQLLAR
jgi:hypothetical protein